MASVELPEMFDVHRLPRGISLLPILLYFPLGLVLALVRFFIGIHVYIIASVFSKTSLIRCLVLRVMCGVLGIWVTQDGSAPKQTVRPGVMVCNYSSTLDHAALELVMPNVMVSVWDLPSGLMWLLGYKDMGAQQGQETLINNIKKHCRESKMPVLAFPEGSMTNGRVGLLRYSIWPFSLDEPIQPVVIQIVRPSIFTISSSVLGSQWWADIFWFLFVPFSLFRIRFLDIVKQTEDETAQDFARRVQVLMANALRVRPTQYTSADKTDLIRKRVAYSQHGSEHSERQSAVNDPMESMVNQVKVVLPDVPVEAIRRDLALTKDTDLTITNILEGRVDIGTSVEDKKTTKVETPQSSRTASYRPSSNASSSFGKSPTERQMSFQQRKEAMYESARRKYLEKLNQS